MKPERCGAGRAMWNSIHDVFILSALRCCVNMRVTHMISCDITHSENKIHRSWCEGSDLLSTATSFNAISKSTKELILVSDEHDKSGRKEPPTTMQAHWSERKQWWCRKRMRDTWMRVAEGSLSSCFIFPLRKLIRALEVPRSCC